MPDDPRMVIDASAVAALLFIEPECDAIAARVAGARLSAPTLLGFEIANVTLTKLKRHPNLADRIAARDRVAALFGLFDQMGIELMPVVHPEVVALAERTGLSAYDASYLWLARHLGAELVTLDRRLAAAAAAP